MELMARIQEILGKKFFRDKVTFDKDVVHKRTITAYSPVAGEPSLGTPHIVTTPTAYLTVPGSAAVVTVNITSYGVPSTAKAVGMRLSIGVNSAVQRILQVYREAAGTHQEGIVRSQGVANVSNDNYCIATVTSGNVYFNIDSTANVTSIVLLPQVYFM